MPYLVAKRCRELGAIAIELQTGKELASISKHLTLKTLERGIDIITVSNLEAYKEYGPYIIIEDKNIFIDMVLDNKWYI